MIVKLGVGLLTIGAAWYAVHRHRRRAKRAGMHKEQLKVLKKIEEVRGGKMR